MYQLQAYAYRRTPKDRTHGERGALDLTRNIQSLVEILQLFTTFCPPPKFWFAHPIFLTSLRQWRQFIEIRRKRSQKLTRQLHVRTELPSSACEL